MDDDHTVRSALLTALAQTLRPPLATLGVPLTHDLSCLTSLITLQGHSSGPLAPSDSNKASLGRTEIVHWRQERAPAQRIGLKGCYAGVISQSEDALGTPVHCSEAEPLSKRLNRHHPETTPSTLTRLGVAACVLHYQRLSTPALNTVSDQADIACEPKGDRSVKRLRPARVAA